MPICEWTLNFILLLDRTHVNGGSVAGVCESGSKGYETGKDVTDGPTSLQTPLCAPADLTARRSAQRARRLRERGLQPVTYPVADVPKALWTPPPDLCRHDLDP